MDLRKKTSFVQNLGEFLLRFRLVLLILFAVSFFVFATDFGMTLAYILGTGESLSQGLSSYFAEGVPATECPFLLEVALLSAVLLLFRFLSGGLQNGLSFLFSVLTLPVLFLLLNEAENALGLVLVLVLAIALVCFLFVRLSFFKALLPFLLVALFGISLSASFGMPYFSVAAFTILGLSDILAVSSVTGAELVRGTPVSGARVAGFSKAFFPMLASTVAYGVASAYFFAEAFAWWKSLVFAGIYAVLFLLAEFPVFSFAPMEKMRADRRTMTV